MQYALKASGDQVERTLNGMPDGAFSQKLSEGAMTPLEMLEHMTEAYVACQKKCGGQEHEWGSYTAPDRSREALLGTWKSERAKAAEAIQNAPAEHQWMGIEFLALHDAYHVGQLCLLRIQAQPDWDPYSIYG